MKLKLDFLFTDLSQHCRIYLVVFYQWAWVRGDAKSSVVKLKVPNLRKRLLRDIN